MIIVLLVTALLVVGIKESARVNNVIVFVKVSILVLLIALGPSLGQQGKLGRPVHSGIGRVVSFRLERNLSGGRAWSSSRTSASTPYRRRPRKPRIRSATCRSASSARSSSARFSTAWAHGADRRRELQAASRARSGRGRDRRDGQAVALVLREDRGDRSGLAR